MKLNLTLSIVSHGHGTLLDGLLHDLNGLAGSDYPTVILTYNIPEIAVDIGKYPLLKIIETYNKEPKGFGDNHNAAFMLCKSSWFAVLNPDLRLPTDPFVALKKTAAKAKHIGVIAPTVFNSAGGMEDAVRGNLTPLSLLLRRTPAIRNRRRLPREGDSFFWIAGMFMLFPSEAYRAVGGFDERFFLYCEDYDICARLNLAGYAVVVDSTASVVHDAQRDSHRSFKHLRLHLVSLLKVWRSKAFWKVTISASRFRAPVPVSTNFRDQN